MKEKTAFTRFSLAAERLQNLAGKDLIVHLEENLIGFGFVSSPRQLGIDYNGQEVFYFIDGLEVSEESWAELADKIENEK